jgi:hypothetical protein
MAKPTERERVANPFSMGPSPTNQPGRLMEQKVPLPKAAFQDFDKGTAMVDALVSFAGVGADQYVKRMNKKIEEDKIIQSGLAIAGARPTDDATVAGYRTHAAVTLKSQILESQAKLNQLAQQGLDDDQWDKAVRDEYKRVDKYLLDNYYNYTTDTEMQKLVPISFREAMPQIVATREADKIEREIQTRINDVFDSLISMDTIDAQTGNAIPPDQLAVNMDRLVKGLQLTSSQKDQAIEDAIIASRSSKLIEAAKIWKGDRKTSLFDRSAKLQKLEESLENERISLSAVSMTTELDGYKDQILGGTLSMEDGLRIIDKRNKELNGRFVSKGWINDLHNQFDKITAANYRQQEIKKILSDVQMSDSSFAKPKERQAGYESIYQDNINRAIESAKAYKPEERDAYLQKKMSVAVARVADMAVAKNDVVDSFVSVLANLASSNVAAREQTGPNGEPILDKTTKQGIQIFNALPSMAKYKHLEKLGGKEARTLRAFMAYRDREIAEPQALKMAQSFMTNPFLADNKRITAGVEDVRSNLEFLWRPDFNNNQEAYLESEIREQIALSPEPDDDSNVDLVTEYFNKGWTTAGHLRLKGSPGYLSTEIGLHVDKLDKAMEGFVWSQKSIWEPQLQALGLDEDDVFPITDPKRGTIQIVARSKAMNSNVYLGKPMALSEIRKYAEQYKEHQQKLADKAMKESWLINQGGILYDKRYPKLNR